MTTADADVHPPDYAGGSIVNLAASVLEAFGVEPPSAPLRAELLPVDALRADGGVVLLVIDALGSTQLQAAVAGGATPHLEALIEAAPAGVQRLTSVFPSTTTAALNSLATACPPAVHGILGHLLWFEHIESIVNMLTLFPLGADEPLDEDALRRVPTIYEQLRRAGVPSTVITDASYEGTPFTNLIQQGAAFAGYHGLSQIPHQLRLALEAAAGRRAFYSLYWPLIDTLSHFHSPDQPGAPSDACRLEMEFVDLMIGKVADLCRRHGCSLILAADHGQTRLDAPRAVRLDEDLGTLLARPPGGGRRVPYLCADDPGELLSHPCLRASCSVVTPMDDAIAAGWFGGDCEGLRSRLGDVLAVGGAGVQFLYDFGRGTYTQLGSHAGLSAEEMHVPLVVAPAP